MATVTALAGGGNWGDGTTWDSLSAPTAADDVRLAATSGNVVVNTGATRVCRSLDCNGYTGTLSGTAALNIGDGTAGAGNIALRLSSGGTYSYSGTMQLISTSTTQQSITCAGASLSCTLRLNGSGGSWILADDFTTTSTKTLAVFLGSFDTASKNISCGTFSSNTGSTRSVTLGTSTITVALTTGGVIDFSSPTGLTFSGASSTVLITNAGSGNKLWNGGGQTWGTVTITTGGTGFVSFNGSDTFTKLGVTGGGTKSIQFIAGTTVTLTGGADCFFSGAASNLITCTSSVATSAWNISKASGTVESDYLSLQDSAAAGGATFYAGANSTNVSGNSGWNFSAPGPAIPVVMNQYRQRWR